MQKDIRRIHDGLKHHEKEKTRGLIRNLNDGAQIPKNVAASIDSFRCIPCATTPEFPRRPKISLPSDTTPNITVSLDVMSHNINSPHQEILVILDHRDMYLKLNRIADRSAETAFNSFLQQLDLILRLPNARTRRPWLQSFSSTYARQATQRSILTSTNPERITMVAWYYRTFTLLHSQVIRPPLALPILQRQPWPWSSTFGCWSWLKLCAT